MPGLDLKDELALIAQTVKAAGEIAKRAFLDGSSAVWDKSEGHPVTEADIAVNDYLTTMLRAARPDYGWLSEEAQDDQSRHNSGRTFVVDPIDGTRAFIDGKDHFVVSVALVENGRSIAGCISNPLRGELFTAMRGRGAWLNGEPLRVTDPDAIRGIRMVGYPRKFRRTGFPDMDISVINSMAYRMVMVASGQADATVSFTPKSDWDLAAAELICQEAGAVVTNLRGEDFRYDQDSVREFGVICAGPTLQALLLERIAPLIAKIAQSKDVVKDFGYMGTRMSDRKEETVQLLHLVIGGELIDPAKTQFKNLKDVDFVGAYGNYKDAREAWKSAAQRTVDNAHMRYFVLHAHELIDPDKDGFIG